MCVFNKSFVASVICPKVLKYNSSESSTVGQVATFLNATAQLNCSLIMMIWHQCIVKHNLAILLSAKLVGRLVMLAVCLWGLQCQSEKLT